MIRFGVQLPAANSVTVGDISSLDSLIVLEIQYYLHLKCNIKESTRTEVPAVDTLKCRETNDIGRVKFVFYFVIY